MAIYRRMFQILSAQNQFAINDNTVVFGAPVSISQEIFAERICKVDENQEYFKQSNISL